LIWKRYQSLNRFDGPITVIGYFLRGHTHSQSVTNLSLNHVLPMIVKPQSGSHNFSLEALCASIPAPLSLINPLVYAVLLWFEDNHFCPFRYPTLFHRCGYLSRIEHAENLNNLPRMIAGTPVPGSVVISSARFVALPHFKMHSLACGF